MVRSQQLMENEILHNVLTVMD